MGLILFPLEAKAQSGCDKTLWKHVYKPARLKVINACFTVTGTIVDASRGRNKDGARHESDGDTHAWLKLDAWEQNLLLPGNKLEESGNMVIEIVCYYPVTQEDAKAACRGYKNTVKLPPIGSHVQVTGALVTDLEHRPLHAEIHPVSAFVMFPPPVPGQPK